MSPSRRRSLRGAHGLPKFAQSNLRNISFMKLQFLKFLATAASGITFCACHAAEITNAPPQARITYPYPEGGVYQFGATVKMVAEASDPDGRVTGVEFFANDELLATLTNSPYVFQWSSLILDFNVRLSVRAYDDQGASATSAPVHIAITQDPSSWVVLSEPKDMELHSAQAKVPVVVKMYGTDDAGAEVQVLCGTNIVARSSDPPYEFALGPLPRGDYTFQARGRVHGNPWVFTDTARVRVIDLMLRQPLITNAALQFQIDGLPTNQLYGIQLSSNMLDWILINSNRASGQTERVNEPLRNSAPTRFYRAVALPE